MKCPVCRSNVESNEYNCIICGFEDTNREFLNIDDAEAWERKVKFAKLVWFMNEEDEDFKHFNANCNTIERTLRQLNAYFNFNEQIENIKQNPTDFVARSWFIDCLREIYILSGTFPLTSRKYVKNIIMDQMNFFETKGNVLGKKKNYIACEHLIHKAEMALSDCDFTDAFKYYMQYLFEIKRQRDIDYLAVIEEAARCVLHNCSVLCELLSVNDDIYRSIQKLADQYYNNEQYKTEDGKALLKRIKSQEHRSIFVHSLGCGLTGAYYSDKDDNWCMKTHEPTINSCVFDYKGIEHYTAQDLSMLDCQLTPIEWINGLMYRIKYITNAFSISDAIYLHKENVEKMAKDILTIKDLFQ